MDFLKYKIENSNAHQKFHKKHYRKKILFINTDTNTKVFIVQYVVLTSSVYQDILVLAYTRCVPETRSVVPEMSQLSPLETSDVQNPGVICTQQQCIVSNKHEA